MVNTMRQCFGYRSGFTVMETIITCVMLGILAAVAIPKVLGPTEFIRSKEGRDTLVALLGSQKRFSLDNGGAYAANFANLDIAAGFPASTIFNAPLANNPGGPGIVGSVARNNGSYTLFITDTGIITCDVIPATAACNAIFCNKGAGNQCN